MQRSTQWRHVMSMYEYSWAAAAAFVDLKQDFNQAVWFLHRFLHRRTGCIGNSRARSVSISISMIESCSGRSTARSAARFKINDWFYHWILQHRTGYVGIAVLDPLQDSMIESIIENRHRGTGFVDFYDWFLHRRTVVQYLKPFTILHIEFYK